jgi:predicted O-linked N-acetylglucosamine transferase (SPINDLY family)
MASIIRESIDESSHLDEACNQGMKLQLAGKLVEAEEKYRAVLQSAPEHAAANHCIGMLHLQSRRATEGVPFLTKALELNPKSPDYWLGLLESLLACGRVEEAIAALSLGKRHGLAGRAVDELSERLATAAERELLTAMEVHDDETALTRARHLVTHMAERGLAWKVLGALLWARGDFDAALTAMQKSVECSPQDAEAHCNFGLALAKTDRFTEAEACLQKALQIDPRFSTAHYRLAMTYMMQTRLAEAATSLRRGLACRNAYTEGDDEANFSSLLFILSHDPSVSPEALFAEHRRFGETFEDCEAWPRLDNDRDPNRRIKVGFVSGDLREHALAGYLEPLLAQLHGRPGLELHAYYNNPVEDHVSEKLKHLFVTWQGVSTLSNAQLADKIRGDGIDILLDLAGHTELNRLPTFARKPAPVQASTMGYPGTTGLRAMDYYLADPLFLPPREFDRYFTEKLVYLPAQAPFRLHASAPDVNPLPALTNQYLTFGSFHRPEKLNRPTIQLWSRLLLALPGSSLILGGVRLDANRDELLREFAACGIETQRLQIHRPCDINTYLGLHHRIDICLDTMPYNGGTTTINALLMGVPTLTIAGLTPAGRSGAAILGAVGLRQFVAASAAEFVRTGTHWADRLTELSALRAGLRGRWEHSTGRSATESADAFESALRQMWQRWCQGRPAKSFRTSQSKPKKRSAPSDERHAEREERALLSLVERRDFEAAVQAARRLIERYPRRSVGWKIYGAFAPTSAGYDDAIGALQQAVRLAPHDAEAHTNLGLTLAKAKRPEEGELHLRKALALQPDFAPAHYRLAVACEFQGKFAESEASLRRGIALRANQVAGDDELSYSHLLFLMSHNAEIGPDELFAEHRRFGTRFEEPLRSAWPQHRNDRNPDRVLKIGFVSGDLCNHAVTTFLEPVLVELAKHRDLEFHAYYTNPSPDSASQRLLGNFKSWNIVCSLTDAELAGVIEKDAIDILIDLSGHTSLNRLPTFARKPAPVQVSWMGYPGTTGLEAMDYYFADPHFLPPGKFDPQFSEKLVYIPTAPFQLQTNAPPVGPLPALAKSHITFGAFNRLGKMNEATLALWARLLRELPESRLLIVGIEVGTQDGPLIERFAALGIAADRLKFHERCGVLTYLGLFNQVDMCLDTTPYNGGTTTINGLSMGVPTLSLAGATPAARQGAAILGQIGLHEFIADTADDFVAKGKHWAARPAELAALRAQLRSRLLDSHERRSDVLAAAVSAAFRRMWQRWCAGLPAESFHCMRSGDATVATAAQTAQ